MEKTIPEGQMLAYTMAGSADSSLIIATHGVTDNASSLASLQKYWSNDYRVACVDARGHGLSPRFSREALLDPLATEVADMICTIEHLNGGEPAILIGHSMGAAVMSAVAFWRPDLVKALILEEPAWLTPQQATQYKEGAAELVKRIKWMRAEMVAALAENRKDYSSWSLAEACGWLQGKLQVDLDFVALGEVSPRQSWEQIARSLNMPTLLITSDGEDVLIGPQRLKEIENLGNHNLKTVILPGTRHCVRREKEAEFYALCDDFLASLDY